MASELERMNVPFRCIRAYPWLEWARQPAPRRHAARQYKRVWNALAERRVKRLLRSGHYDILHINSSAIALGARSARDLGLPVVWHVREFNTPESGRVFSDPPRQMAMILQSSAVIAVSDAVSNPYLLISDRCPVMTVYDAVTPPDRPRDAMKILTDAPFHLAVVGAVMPAKGQLEVVRALQVMKETSDYTPTLKLIGPHVDRGYLQKLRTLIDDGGLENQVSFTGGIQDVYHELRRTDVLIVSSLSESFGRATMEGMLSGCLVIGANNTGTRELLSEGRGVLYNGVASDLAVQIVKAFEDPARSRQAARKGQLFGIEVSESGRSTKQIVEAFREVGHSG